MCVRGCESSKKAERHVTCIYASHVDDNCEWQALVNMVMDQKTTKHKQFHLVGDNELRK